MLEIININEKKLSTKDLITIDIIRDGQEFLRNFDLDNELILDCVSIIYRFLNITRKIPHNIYKFYIAAYFIASRHPRAFHIQEPKKRFCRRFGIEIRSLDYSVEKISNILGFIKILDDKNNPYFFEPKKDIAFELIKKIVKSETEKVMMMFLLYHQAINSQILSEDLTNKIIFEMKMFPEELFRQFFEIINQLVEKNLQSYYEYVELQQNVFI
jgi:hypothetical protein